MARKYSFSDYVPFSLSVLFFVGVLVFHAALIEAVAEQEILLGNLYAAVFDWSAIQTGFLFAVYGFLVSKNDGFIGMIQRTAGMRSFRSYVSRATLIAFVLTFASLVLLVHPVFPTSFNWIYVLVSAWLSLFVWAFALFCRIAFLFGKVARVPDHPK